MAEILIIDDDEQFCDMLAQQVRRDGHGVSLAHTVQAGIQKAQLDAYDVVFLDVNLPDGSGLEELPKFQEGLLPAEVIIITGFGDADSAELAIKSGVWEYINKRSSMESVRLSLTRALQYREGKQATATRVALDARGIVGNSPNFKACLDVVAQAAGSNASVLITGETGTGKELLARAIHANSPRAEGQFVVVDCTVLPKTLIESVLLGHEKGVFTGADKAHDGLVKQAGGGTLFLDEVGELPLEAQKAFLRVLQERSFRPLGATREVESDFRLVAATHRDLDCMAEAGEFRRDFLFRLRSLTIHLPSLRERRDDLQALAVHLVDEQCKLHGVQLKGIASDFHGALCAYDWPGNVRELVNAIESAVASAGGEPALYMRHLPTHIRVHMARADYPAEPEPATRSDDALAGPLSPLKKMREDFEKRYLQELVARTGSDIEAACKISGLSRGHIYVILRKHGLTMR
jgi:two-component system, NtrC family, response regulator